MTLTVPRAALCSLAISVLAPAAAMAGSTPIGSPGSGAGQFVTPSSIAFAPGATVLIADRDAGRITRLNSDGSFAGFVNPPNNQPIPHPEGVASDPQNRTYVADPTQGWFGRYSPGNSSSFNNNGSSPVAVAPGPGDGIFVVYRSIRPGTSNTNLVELAGGSSSYSFGPFGSGEGQLNSPEDIALDAAGNVYVLDSGNFRVAKFAPSGAFIANFGTGQFGTAEGLTVGPTGWIYIADRQNGRIVRLDPNGQPDGTFSPSSVGDSVPNPTDVGVDGQENLWIVGPGGGRRYDTNPYAFLTASPAAPRVGETVTLDASKSLLAFSTITRWEFDLDNNGTYETDRGTPTITHVFTTTGLQTVRVRVTSNRGTTAPAELVLNVGAAGPGSGPPGGIGSGIAGVSINRGARFTRSANVVLTLWWPPGTVDLLVSNSATFTQALRTPIAQTVKWTLDTSPGSRNPRTVHARIGNLPDVYKDSIVLDRTKPSLRSATIEERAAASSARAAAAARRFVIRLSASDGTSGVGRVQIVTRKGRLANLRAYRRTIVLRRVTKPRYVRVVDRAGNVSAWRSLRTRG